MPFPIQAPLTAAEFRSRIIDHYWADWGGKTLQQKIDDDASCPASNKAVLIDDWCKLGSFLSYKTKVLAGLVKLETAIREELQKDARAQVRDQIGDFAAIRRGPRAANRRGEPVIFKTHKLLSGVLGREEMRCGFNGLDAMGRPVARSESLHSKANVGVKDAHGNVLKTAPAGFQKQPGGRTQATAVALPSGVPGMTGGVGGMDFLRILLRHGYQWKDVGAGATDHGEYTHRLQWYAITANNETSPDLSLTNTPLEIFRSMGCLFARSTWPLPLDQQVEHKTTLWEVIFDCFTKPTGGSPAVVSGDIFNCPDHLCTEISKIKGDETAEFKAAPANLYCLRVLMSARRTKRFGAVQDPLAHLMDGSKKVKEAYSQDGADAYLAWYVTE